MDGQGEPLEAKQLAYATSMTGVTDESCSVVPAFSDEHWVKLVSWTLLHLAMKSVPITTIFVTICILYL